jgi:hypothetical protein
MNFTRNGRVIGSLGVAGDVASRLLDVLGAACGSVEVLDAGPEVGEQHLHAAADPDLGSTA